jgi:hypothetical protein
MIDFNKLLECPMFEFIRSDVNLRNALKDIALNAQDRFSAVDKSNFINLEGEKRHVSVPTWNKMYAFIIRSASEKHFDFTSEKLDSILKPNKVTETNHYFKCISSVIMEILNSNEKNYHINVLKLILKDLKASEQFLSIVVQSFIMQEYRKRKQHDDAISFPFTSSAYKFGLMTCKYFFDTNRYFINILNVLTSKKDIKTVSLTEINEFVFYIRAVLTKNTEQELFIYKKWENFDVNNKVLIDVTRSHILNIVYKQYQCDKIPFAELQDILTEFRSKFIKGDLYKNSNEIYVKLGSIMIDYMVNAKILDKVTKRFSETKSQLMLTVDEDIIANMMDLFSFNRPCLIEENAKWLADNEANDQLYKVMLENTNNFIHENPDIRLEIKDDCYLLKQKPLIKYTIDVDYLKFFLMGLYDYYTKVPINDADRLWQFEMIQVLLTMYDLDYLELVKQFADDPEATNLLNELVYFGLDFNNMSPKAIREKIKAYKGIHRDTLINTLNKMYSYKIYIVGLIKDSVLYSLFKSFLVALFIDTRARSYLSSIMTNVHSFPYAKMFVKFVMDTDHAENFESNYKDIRRIVADELVFPEQKQKILSMTLKEYKKKDKELGYNYIYDFFNPDLMSKAEFKQLYYNDNLVDYNTLFRIKNTLRKAKRTFIVHSMLLLERYNSDADILNYFELDATCSGLQMVSLLLNSNDLAKLSNLIGDVKSDVYNEALMGFTEQIESLNKVVDSYRPFVSKGNDILKDINDLEGLNLNKEEFSLYTDIYERFKAFCSMDISRSSYAPNLINKLYEDLSVCNIILDLQEFNWLLSSNDMELHTWPTIEIPFKSLQSLMLVRKIFRLKSIILTHPWLENNVFSNRDLFKKPIMTYFYNATSYGRKEHFIEFLWTHSNYLQKSYRNLKLVTFVSSITEQFFSYFMTSRVPDATKMLDLSKYLTSQQKPIIINNRYFKITFDPRVMRKQIIQTASFRKGRGSQVTINIQTDATDSKMIKQRFNPNFIHSMDASIVHHYYRRLLKMNERLKEIYLICFHANHDQFGISLRPFLKIILEDGYRELHESNYIDTLENIDPSLLSKIKALVHENKLNLQKINEYFIK